MLRILGSMKRLIASNRLPVLDRRVAPLIATIGLVLGLWAMHGLGPCLGEAEGQHSGLMATAAQASDMSGGALVHSSETAGAAGVPHSIGTLRMGPCVASLLGPFALVVAITTISAEVRRSLSPAKSLLSMSRARSPDPLLFGVQLL